MASPQARGTRAGRTRPARRPVGDAHPPAAPVVGPSAQWLEQAVEHSADLIAMADVDGRLTLVNRAFLNAVGQSRDHVVGQHFRLALSDANPPGLIQEIGEHCLRDDGWKGECLFATGDGTTRPIFLSVGPVKDEAGRVVGSFGIAQDMSDRKRVEDALRQSEAQFRQLAEQIREVFFIMTPEPFQLTYVSPAFDDIWGRPRQELYDDPMTWSVPIHADDREVVETSFTRALSGVPTEMEFRVVRPDQTERWIQARTFPVREPDGAFRRVVGIAEDITRRKDEEAALREAHARLDAALRVSEQQVRDADRLSEVIDILQSCSRVEEAYAIAGSMLPPLLGTAAGALYITSPSRDTVEAVAQWGPDAATARVFTPEDCWALRRGQRHLVLDPASPVRCPHVGEARTSASVCLPLVAHGETLGVLHVAYADDRGVPTPGGSDAGGPAVVRQVVAVGERLSLTIANLRLRDVLRHQSIRDPLTGLFNRRYMEESLERECRRAVRLDQPVSVLMLDLDHFKRFNDTFGHQAGDALLRAVGELLGRQTRTEDVACRYGGEEFAIVLAGTDAADAAGWAQRMRDDLKQLVATHAGQVLGTITVSIGIAGYPDHGDTAEKLLHTADQALYRAKAAGRDQVVSG